MDADSEFFLVMLVILAIGAILALAGIEPDAAVMTQVMVGAQ